MHLCVLVILTHNPVSLWIVCLALVCHFAVDSTFPSYVLRVILLLLFKTVHHTKLPFYSHCSFCLYHSPPPSHSHQTGWTAVISRCLDKINNTDSIISIAHTCSVTDRDCGTVEPCSTTAPTQPAPASGSPESKSKTRLPSNSTRV